MRERKDACALGWAVELAAARASRLGRENSEESQAVTQDTQDASDAVLQCPSVKLAFPDACLKWLPQHD